MDTPRIEPASPALPGAPHLRLVDGRAVAPEHGEVSPRAWIVLFGSLAAAGGHGVFLFTALTRLEKLPGRTELGGPLELAALAWFVAAVPLALLSLPLRAPFLRLRPAPAWSLASAVAVLTLAAFAFYLRAVALA